MQSTAQGFKLIKKIKDDRFDEEKLHQYELLIQLGIRDLQIAIVDTQDSRLLFFEDYVLGDLSSHAELLILFKTLFDSHPVIQAGFWKEVKISIKNTKFAQVPGSLFLEEAAAEYLQFNAPLDQKKEDILTCRNNLIDAVTVFAIQKELLEWFKLIYKNTTLTVVHQSTALIEGVLQYARSDEKMPLYIYVDRFKLHILAVKKGKLVYYNQFLIKQFSDYVKYIMLVMKGLSLDQNTSEVILWGYIGKNSPHYQEFIKYVRNVSFGGRPSYIRFGYLFDEVQEHHFFDLYSIHLLNRA
ncbi:MAG TPA: DUF3822 family protein [Cyclobacteriaceae bacterium]|nr:DUF3822 family protein [Cyclobacteriaceae bacterium]HPW63048.1 DUF3822 family protein [Cyclobacteriaceae bacterium]